MRGHVGTGIRGNLQENLHLKVAMRLNMKMVNKVRLQNLSYGHKKFGTLKAGIQLELFTKVSHCASGISEIAREVGLGELNAERLAGCTALQLLEKEGGNCRNAPDVERFLLEDKVTYSGP